MDQKDKENNCEAAVPCTGQYRSPKEMEKKSYVLIKEQLIT